MEIDPTVVAFETINFVVLVAILRRFLFRPVREALEKRRGEVEAARAAAEQRQSEAAATRSEYEVLAAELREQRQERIDEAVAQGRTDAHVIVTDAREQARRRLEDADAEIEAARRRALVALRREVAVLATAAAQRVVAHLGVPSVVLGFTRRAAHALADELSDAPPREVDVAHGPDDDPAAIEQALRESFGPDVMLRLEVDPAIVAGVRLQASGHEVEASASASLDDWYEREVSGTAERPSATLSRTG